MSEIRKITKEELAAQYAASHPFEPNNIRIGKYAKELGLTLVKQMINGKYVSFYVKEASNNQ